MLQSSDIRKKALNKWPQYRRSVVSTIIYGKNNTFFPLKIEGDRTPLREWEGMIDEYKEITSSSKEKLGKGYSIVWDERKTREKGIQSFIKEITIDTEEDYLFLTEGKSKTEALKNSLSVLSSLFISLSSPSFLIRWIEKNTKELENTQKDKEYWKKISSVIKWAFMTEDTSSYYLREIPLPIHTKFIENNSSTIITLFRALKGEEDIKSGGLDINDVLNLKKKPVLIRFRINHSSFIYKEMAVDSSSFSILDTTMDLSHIKRIFVIENEAVYLSFPIIEGEMVIFGSGFKSKIIKGSWIDGREVYYFGDLDEHGLFILSLFRSMHRGTKSFLMDEKTYSTFSNYAVKGEKVDENASFSFLYEEEKTLLSLLRSKNENRLEQERIDQEYIKLHLSRLRDNNE